MDSLRIKYILESVRSGKLSVEEAMNLLRDLPYEDLSFAKVDHHRMLRQGIPEVIFAKGKGRRELVKIASAMVKKSGRALITRASKEAYKALRRHHRNARFYEASGVITIGEAGGKRGGVLVLCAGTSDIPVAEEAMVTASFLGSKAEMISDVGVAGLHRLLSAKKAISQARVLIVVAGMEGALPSVIGGVTDKPIIAVPTSVGYGTSLSGLTALFAMLNSCVPGIAVMNIDNGFGAGVLAHKINKMQDA